MRARHGPPVIGGEVEAAVVLLVDDGGHVLVTGGQKTVATQHLRMFCLRDPSGADTVVFRNMCN